VLVVDDNRDAADSAVMLLHIWGHEAVAAYTGTQCLQTAKSFDPDVVLMDIGLPGRDGFEVKEELEQICPGVRVVALTGYTQADIKRRTRAEGFAGHLVKPVEPPELKNAVNEQCAIAKAL
jgi:CheY-like chemotaxis protein